MSEHFLLQGVLLALGNIQDNTATKYFNPLSPTSDLHRISPYSINMISSRQVIRLKKNIKGLLVDPIPNSPN